MKNIDQCIFGKRMAVDEYMRHIKVNRQSRIRYELGWMYREYRVHTIFNLKRTVDDFMKEWRARHDR